MDAIRFDALTRSLSSRSSRRVTLGGLTAGFMVALGLAPDEPTVLANKKKNKGKGNNKKNKKKDCPRKNDSRLDQDKCGQDCTNFLIDDDNCGGCATTGNPPGAICLPGRTTCVEGKCVEGDTDPSNCVEGTGSNVCPPETVCCAEPIGQGDPQVYELHCRNLRQDKNHCGSCNHACTEGKDPACCYGRCRDLHADPLNCGACVHRCPRDKPLCSAGTCYKKCPQGLTKCGNTCMRQSTEACCNGRVIAKEDLQFDDKNCGDCGRDCSKEPFATGECCGGECCDINASECCSGQCTNIILNDENCGECGKVCGPNEFCRFGDCTCPPGSTCP
jgi:hypothetical protein